MNEENYNPEDIDLENTEEVNPYDEIITKQQMSIEDLKEHMTGPVIAILIHAIILPFVIGMVINEPVQDQPEVQMESVTEEVVPPPPPPPPPEIKEPDVTTPDDRPFDKPVVEDPTDVTMEEPEIKADIMVETITNPFVIKTNNSAKVLASASPFGRKGGAGGSGGSGGGYRMGLRGVFYDMKQDQNGSANGVGGYDQNKFTSSILTPFVKGGWNQNSLNKYYKSPTNLYASCFYIPRCKAEEAPKAYECADKVQPSRWMAVYSGKVRAPKTGTFRFAGAGDDVITVAVNKRTVLDYGWTQVTLGCNSASNLREWMAAMEQQPNANPTYVQRIKEAGVYKNPASFYKYSATPHWNGALGGICVGDSVSVNAGEIVDIDILISEIPGGEFGACLFIEDVDMHYEYAKDPQTGSPILPLFRTDGSLPPPSTGQIPPFMPGGPVWRLVGGNAKGADPATVPTPVQNENLIEL